jgi:twitching motility two-component system response regulator PilH
MVKILVVDDAEFFRKLYSEKLMAAGFEVETAENGNEAVTKIKASRPSLVLMDYVMPQATGGEALDVIKADPDIKSTPVVMLTSIAGDIKGEDLLLKGASAYLVKDSVTPEDVVAKVKEMLGTSDAPMDPTKSE